MSTAPRWWDQLPDDFFRQPDGTELDRHHRFKVGATAAVDRVMRSVLAGMMSLAMAPAILSRSGWQREIERLKYYAKLADLADSALAFPRPRRGIQVQELRPSRLAYGPRGIPYRMLSFDSPFQPLNPELRQSYGGQRRNARAGAQYWFHKGGPRPTLIVIHGFLIDPYWLNAQMFSLRWFYQQGYDVLLYTLPFHGHRGEHWDWFSGYRLFAGGLAQFNEAMAHAIHDVRVFMDYLERQGVRRIGVTGLSLGGYTSALLAAVDERLAFCIPNSPVVSPVDLMREWQPLGMLAGARMKRSGTPLSELRHGLAMHAALTYAPKIASERMLIIGGAGDRFTPPRHVRLLHGHFPGSQLHWFPGNHLLHLRQGEYLRLMKRFMDRHSGLSRD
ncbi:MAG: abhydrolase 18 [Nevskia sp.]|nr:abhydrolase 18 [Nevskia sp.]